MKIAAVSSTGSTEQSGSQTEPSFRRFPMWNFRPTEYLLAGYLGVIAAVLVLWGAAVPARWWLVAIHLLLIAGIVWLFWRPPSEASGLRAFLQFWYFLPLTIFLFKEQALILTHLRPVDFDQLLINLDAALFGAHPTVYLERMVHPLLTEILAWAYIMYFFLPVTLGIFLYRSKSHRAFENAAFAVILSFCISLVGYLLVPAIGPRFTLEHLQTVPLHGVFLADAIRDLLNQLEQIQRDCFPSGHTMIALISLYYAKKYFPLLGKIYLPVVLALIFSTVYLRYHYAVDVLAGMALAGFCVLVSELAYGEVRVRISLPRTVRQRLTPASVQRSSAHEIFP